MAAMKRPTSEPNLCETELLNLEKANRQIDPRQKRTERQQQCQGFLVQKINKINCGRNEVVVIAISTSIIAYQHLEDKRGVGYLNLRLCTFKLAGLVQGKGTSPKGIAIGLYIGRQQCHLARKKKKVKKN